MAADSSVPDPAKAAPQAKPAAKAPAAKANESWGMRRNPRNSAPLRLVSALRGQGGVIWSGGSVTASYELDLFDRGAVHMASGNLEGDFSALVGDDEGVAAQAAGARLRLDDGRELDIDLLSLEADYADFEAHGADLAALAPPPKP